MSDTAPRHEETACAAALAALDVSPARLRRLLAGRSPSAAWEALAAGAHPEDPDGLLRAPLLRRAPDAVLRRCAAEGVAVHALGVPGYPPCLAQDGEAPAVLFSSGDLHSFEDRPRVAVVGTRGASAAGLEIARDIGSTLAAAGVVVVSGLATGVDSAALEGALRVPGAAAPPVAVLGTPHGGRALPSQRQIAARIASLGAVLSEQAPGSGGARWRFAARNRIMAAMARLVVVVECHEQGGALYTVRAARRRGVPVAAVPGAVHAPASAGTNALLAEGAACVRHGDDVLAQLWRSCHPESGTDASARRVTRRRRMPATATPPDPVAAAVLDVLGPEPADLDAVVRRARRPVGAVAVALEQLSDLGLAEQQAGWWRRLQAGRVRG